MNISKEINLYEFQKEILELIPKRKRLLILMSRGAGKSFLFDYLTGRDGRNERGSRAEKVGDTTFIDEVYGLDKIPEGNVVIFSSYNETLNYDDFDFVERFDIYRLMALEKGLFDEDLTAKAKKSLSEKTFKNEYLCIK